jgi:hypothetical protein
MAVPLGREMMAALERTIDKDEILFMHSLTYLILYDFLRRNNELDQRMALTGNVDGSSQQNLNRKEVEK